MLPRLFLAPLLSVALMAGPAVATAQTVILVRHAEKADDSKDPDLSPAGLARAEALARALAGARLSRVLTTPLKRTVQTGFPAALATGLTPTSVSLAGGAAAHAARVAAAAREAPEDAVVLVVGHSNTVPDIARALGDPDPEPLGDCDYDRMTILVLGEPGAPAKAVHARYGAASPAC